MRRFRWLFAVIAAVAVLALWWVFLVSPRRADVEDLNAQRDSAIARQQTLRTERAALLDIQENELTYITAAASLERLIPPTPDLATFIDDVTLLAATTGVQVNSLSPSPPSAQLDSTFQEITVGMDVEGQFFEILGFLYGLADMERLVRVDGLSLDPTEGETGEIVMTTSLDVTIFTTSAVTVPEGGTLDGTTDTGDGTEDTGDGTEDTGDTTGDAGDGGDALGVTP